MRIGAEGWDSGCKPYYTIKNSLMVYYSSCENNQAACLEDRLVADVLGL